MELGGSRAPAGRPEWRASWSSACHVAGRCSPSSRPPAQPWRAGVTPPAPLLDQHADAAVGVGGAGSGVPAHLRLHAWRVCVRGRHAVQRLGALPAAQRKSKQAGAMQAWAAGGQNIVARTTMLGFAPGSRPVRLRKRGPEIDRSALEQEPGATVEGGGRGRRGACRFERRGRRPPTVEHEPGWAQLIPLHRLAALTALVGHERHLGGAVAGSGARLVVALDGHAAPAGEAATEEAR